MKNRPYNGAGFFIGENVAENYNDSRFLQNVCGSGISHRTEMYSRISPFTPSTGVMVVSTQ